MKALGIFLIAASFLGNAFVASLDAKVINWMIFTPVLLLGFIGVFLLKKASNAEATNEAQLSGSVDVLSDSLNNIVKNLHELQSKKAELPTYEARFEIDRRFREDLNQFAESRQSMVHLFGLQQYADVMSSFAAGERYINRVWSASTDGYVDEVNKYIDKATTQFDDAHALFNRLLESTKQA